MRIRKTALAFASMALIALVSCAAVPFPHTDESAITITLEPDGSGRLGLQTPSGDPAPQARKLATLAFPGQNAITTDPSRQTSSFAELRVVRAFDPAHPAFDLDIGALVRGLDTPASVLVSVCTPAGVPTSVSARQTGTRDSHCTRWDVPAGSSAFGVGVVMSPTPWRLPALGLLSIVMLVGGATVLMAGRGSGRSARRMRAFKTGTVALGLLLWLRLAPAAQQGSIDMNRQAAWLASGVRILAIAALVSGLISAVAFVVILAKGPAHGREPADNLMA